MLLYGEFERKYHVAPFAGAWIEMLEESLCSESELVAPFAGAWIEILQRAAYMQLSLSLPSRERGLK